MKTVSIEELDFDSFFDSIDDSPKPSKYYVDEEYTPDLELKMGGGDLPEIMAYTEEHMKKQESTRQEFKKSYYSERANRIDEAREKARFLSQEKIISRWRELHNARVKTRTAAYLRTDFIQEMNKYSRYPKVNTDRKTSLAERVQSRAAEISNARVGVYVGRIYDMLS